MNDRIDPAKYWSPEREQERTRWLSAAKAGGYIDAVLDPTDSDAPAATFATLAGSVDATGALTPEARADLERSIETAAQEVAAIDLGAARRRYAADFAAVSVRYAAYRDDALTAMAAEVAAAGGEPDEIAIDPGSVEAARAAGLEVDVRTTGPAGASRTVGWMGLGPGEEP